MKKTAGRVCFRMVLPCLALAAILTLPSAVTWSKYVWQDEIKLTLTLNYPDQGLTSLLSVFPDADCTLDGNGIRIEAAEISGQWILSAEDGYTLPESIIVQVGGSGYPVDTNGQNDPETVSFDPASGALTVADSLLADSGGSVTVMASGVPEAEQSSPADSTETAEAEAISDESPASDEPAQPEDSLVEK